MIRATRLEFRKMRRLRTLPILTILVVAVAALSSISLFAGSTRETFDDPAAMPWAALMLTYTLMAAMTSPILTAVLASRQTDIEHSGSGWNLAGSAGYTPGLLCRAKLAALSLVLLPAIVAQTLLVIGMGKLAGITVPLDVVGLPWFFGHLMWRGLVARECGGCWSVVEPGSATTSAGPHLTGLQGPRPGPESLLQLCRPLRGGGGRVGGDAGSRGACGAVHLRPGVRDRSRADLRGRTGRSVAGCGSDRFSSGPGCWGREPQGAGTVAELDTDSVGMPMVSMATALLDPLEVQGGGGL